MKVSHSIRALYENDSDLYEELKDKVDNVIASLRKSRWHYESRIKTIESFAQKLETGRVKDPSKLEDRFACTLVVENESVIPEAERLITQTFDLTSRRPKEDATTHLKPDSFSFDDLRLYVRLRAAGRPLPIHELVFEIQVKTFLQHAWGIATHDLVYKARTTTWGLQRVAYQIKAMLEHAEASIASAEKITGRRRTNKSTDEVLWIIKKLEENWDDDQLPTDRLRLAESIQSLASCLTVKADMLFEYLKEATSSGAGAGANRLDISPFSAIVEATARATPHHFAKQLKKKTKSYTLIVPAEVELPDQVTQALKTYGTIVEPPIRRPQTDDDI